MYSINGRSFLLRDLWRILFPVLILLCSQNSVADAGNNDSLYSSEYSDFLYEINEIQFRGNSNIKDFELLLLINSTVTDKSPVFGILDFYYTNMRHNPYSPTTILSYIEELAEEHTGEIKYFNKPVAEDDAASVRSYYNMLGFHEARVEYSFFPSDESESNILRFTVYEGPRYTVDSIYVELPDGISENIKGGKRLHEHIEGLYNLSGKPFNEDLVIRQVQLIDYEFKNNGYYFTEYKILPVKIDSLAKTDDIYIVFEPGRRQTIGKTEYINTDTSDFTRKISTRVKKRYSRIKPGNIYRIGDIEETEQNFNTLGFFEKIHIDTFDIDAPDTLNFRIKTKLGNRYELDAGLFLNHTPADNNVNSGIEGLFTFRNPFGGAEEMVYYGNITAKDINNFVTTRKFEGKLGVNFFQQMIWYVNGSTIGGAGNIEYSRNNMDGFLVDHWYLPKISFPWYLKKYTHFNKITFNISLEGEYPLESDIGIDSTTVDNANTNIIRRMVFFETLKKYWSADEGFRLWSGAIAGISAIGDHRNHPFSPTHGHYTAINIEGAGLLGIAEFANIHVTHRQFAFQKHHRNIVHAYQINIGKIFYDRSNTDKYVPFESQYFAGGAGSNRGWAARELHASDIRPVREASSSADTMLTEERYRKISNIYGNSGLFEVSYELRYNFIKHSGLADIKTDRISNFGLVWFVDIGNAYGWFIDENDKPDDKTFSAGARYFFENLAVASGLGIRYDTPIGPIRLDFGVPLYGPVFGKDDLIFRRARPLSDIKIHFGIGHSF